MRINVIVCLGFEGIRIVKSASTVKMHALEFIIQQDQRIDWNACMKTYVKTTSDVPLANAAC